MSSRFVLHRWETLKNLTADKDKETLDIMASKDTALKVKCLLSVLF